MANNIESATNVATGTPERLSNEGKNPTRDTQANSTEQAESNTSTGPLCADLRASEPERGEVAGVTLERVLGVAARAWIVAVGRLLHLDEEGAQHVSLPLTRYPEGVRRPAAIVGDLAPCEPAELLRWARVLGAALVQIASLAELERLSLLYRVLYQLAYQTRPRTELGTATEGLGLVWVHECIRVTSLLAPGWGRLGEAELAESLACHIPAEPGRAGYADAYATPREEHAYRVVAATYERGHQAVPPERVSMQLVREVLADWHQRAFRIEQYEAHWAEDPRPSSAWGVVWCVGHIAQMEARRDVREVLERRAERAAEVQP